MKESLLDRLLGIRRHEGAILKIDLGPIYREHVTNLAPHIRENGEVINGIAKAIGAREVIIKKEHSRMPIMLWDMGHRAGERVSIDDVLDNIERYAYDDYVHEIAVYLATYRLAPWRKVYGIAGLRNKGGKTVVVGGVQVYPA